jgi:hypothetical protein
MSDIRASVQAQTPHPLVTAIEGYLRERSAFPQIVGGRIPDGSTAKFAYGGDYPPQGLMTLGPTAGEDSYAHELTHAAERQLIKQYGAERKTPSQFTNAYEKLGLRGDGFKEQAVRLMDPRNPYQQSEYRMYPPEVLAFGVESMVNPKDAFTLGGHSSATLATELAILLELASRQKK